MGRPLSSAAGTVVPLAGAALMGKAEGVADTIKAMDKEMRCSRLGDQNDE